MNDSGRIFGIPLFTPEQFNAQAAKQLGYAHRAGDVIDNSKVHTVRVSNKDIPVTAELDVKIVKEDEANLQWQDHNEDARPQANELSGAKVGEYAKLIWDNDAIRYDWRFTPKFEKLYRSLAENYRQQLVAEELALTYSAKNVTNLETELRKHPDVTTHEIELYKQGLAFLTGRVAELVRKIYQDQIGYNNTVAEGGFAKWHRDDHKPSMELLKRQQQPWCLYNKDPFCNAFLNFAERDSGVFPTMPSPADCAVFGKSLVGEGNPFSVIKNDGGWKRVIPYAEYYETDQQLMANYLRMARDQFEGIPREKSFAAYLNNVANALESNAPFPYQFADAAWIEHGKSDSILFARIGPDEPGTTGNVGDKCGLKSRFHMHLGIKDATADELVQRFFALLPKREQRFAELIDNPALYQARSVALNAPEFVHIIMNVGNGHGAPQGITVAQTLPNWCGPEGTTEPCPRRQIMYMNKGALALDKEIRDKYIMPLIHEDDRGYADGLARVDVEINTSHETAHNLGPRWDLVKPGGTQTYAQLIGRKYLGTLEELKATNAATLFAADDYRAAMSTTEGYEVPLMMERQQAELAFKQHVATRMVGILRMVMRATRSGNGFHGGAYSKLAAIQLDHFTREGGIVFDKATQTFKFDYPKIAIAAETLQRKVLKLYAEADPKAIGAFIDASTTEAGKGYKNLQVQRVLEVAAKMPSVIIEYEIVDGAE